MAATDYESQEYHCHYCTSAGILKAYLVLELAAFQNFIVFAACFDSTFFVGS
jgi:hypothetical protein